jgi:hypothetical protein
MVSPLMPVDPQRLRHGGGEALLRRDLADQAAQDDQVRWWHSRALHRAYGVVDGLEVTMTMVEGATAAEVRPGLAYDCHGRELLLGQPRQVAVPDDPDGLVLVLTHDARAAGGVTLRWLPRSSLAVRDGVPLTTAGDAATLAAPRARPLARPRIGNGATIVGETAWRPWVERARATREVLYLGVQVDIDTKAAGFTAVPCYFVQLNGSMWDPQFPTFLLLPFGHVAGAGKDRFTFRLLMPWVFQAQELQRDRGEEPAADAPSGGERLLDAHERELPVGRARAAAPSFRSAFRGLGGATGLAVTWIGIQHDRDLPPAQPDPNGGMA